ncbi:DNA (cytosine-5-)-methyltransferase [Mesorhizobium sp. VK23B]|uniref:Cytosine-specific methyltransferase n=1 Tax=Mesorhizobium dulcispinae TaxID=3072316 RepID=A0ABU4X9Q8_9HYPH|nr:MULTISPECIES: DNA (cytosine-5-)-methyltransferase [unclassified Mesorhizobium]MDX8465657.1 DNA (cytosine-5-)-methyltransferase [Mesorhizobium sp. VK23B]MDX8471541.1 DNA (cytosine-5-)-methyltransferase [Mesorhizobium sp. VK23A]
MKVVELYAGAGGMSLGLKRAGFEVVRAYDHMQCAVDVYNRNLGYHAELADLGDVASIAPKISRLKPDLIVGGPPCQDFSPAGARVEGERANHTRTFALYVCSAAPNWFMMENVQRARNSNAWRDAREMLANAGYGLTQLVVNASHYGVPQKRQRLIVVGRRGERDGFLLGAIQQAASRKPMPLRAVFGDVFGDHIYNHPRTPGRRGIWSVDGPSPTIRNARRPQPASYEPHPNDSNYNEVTAGFYFRPFHDARGVYSLDEPAPSIVRTSRERPRSTYIASPHPDDPSPAASAYILTQKDTARIQGFPADWDWSGCLSRDIDQMIANAVPAPMAAALGKEILRRERGESHPGVPGNFGQWLAKEKNMAPQMVANAKWRVKRARQLLGGRDLRCLGAEAHALEAAFERECLSKAKRSEIRRALRQFREWQEKVQAGI